MIVAIKILMMIIIVIFSMGIISTDAGNRQELSSYTAVVVTAALCITALQLFS